MKKNLSESIYTISYLEQELYKIEIIINETEIRLKNDELLISMFENLHNGIKEQEFEKCSVLKRDIIKHCIDCQYDIK